MKFNRQIGEYAGKHFDVYGNSMTREEFEAYLPTVLPTDKDRAILADIFKEKDWIVPKGEKEFEPSEGARRVN